MAGSAVAENPGEPRECSTKGDLENVGEQPETAICQKPSTLGSHLVALAKVLEGRLGRPLGNIRVAMDGKGAVPRLLVRVRGCCCSLGE